MMITLTKKHMAQITAIAETAVPYQGSIFLRPQDVHVLIGAHRQNLDIMEQEKEYFYTLGLDTKNQLKFIDVVSVGTLNYSIVHPREVFRRAIIVGCASVIITHNHPSGCIEPSEADRELTKRLVEAGKILGIEVLDHVICSSEKWYSFKEGGLI